MAAHLPDTCPVCGDEYQRVVTDADIVHGREPVTAADPDDDHVCRSANYKANFVHDPASDDAGTDTDADSEPVTLARADLGPDHDWFDYDVVRIDGDTHLLPPQDAMADAEWRLHSKLSVVAGQNVVPADPEVGDKVGIRLADAYSHLFAVGDTVAADDAVQRIWDAYQTNIEDLIDAMLSLGVDLTDG